MNAKLLKLGFCVVVIAALIIVPMNFNRYGLYILSQWAVMTIAAMGLNLTLGYAGQVSLAQGAFVGIGAYTAAIMTSSGFPLIAALAVAIVLCFAVGWILGYPALRVQHHYLAFVTLAFSTLATTASPALSAELPATSRAEIDTLLEGVATVQRFWRA